MPVATTLRYKPQHMKWEGHVRNGDKNRTISSSVVEIVQFFYLFPYGLLVFVLLYLQIRSSLRKLKIELVEVRADSLMAGLKEKKTPPFQLL